MLTDMTSGATLHRVFYGERAAVQQTDKLIADLTEAWNRGHLVKQPDGSPSYDVGLNLFRAIATFKHKSFAAEDEWRLLAMNEVGYPVHTRPRATGLLPYKNIIVNPRRGDVDDRVAQTVTEIVVGPAPDQEAQVEAVKALLLRRTPAFDSTTVRISEIPFRD